MGYYDGEDNGEYFISFGKKGVNGSIRIIKSGSDIHVEKKIEGEWVSQGTIPASGGGSVTPGETLMFDGTLDTTTQDTNAVVQDYTWEDSVEHADITHTDGDSEIEFDEDGEYVFYYNIEVTNGLANNRNTWKLALDHLSNDDVSYFEYTLASSVYIRDDADTYDSGCASGCFTKYMGAGDKIIIRSRRLDTGDATGTNPADQTASYLRIFKKTY